MCGIVGYIGTDEASSILLTGLRELEYRGYDSAGIAVLEEDGFQCFRAVGKLHNLVARVGDYRSRSSVAGIGHTRWATHGKPTEANAHPHGLTHARVVHNGIIENYMELRDRVETPFSSQTDTEVIVHLFEKHLAAGGTDHDHASILAAFKATLDDLRGAYAILLLTEHLPDHIFFARKGSPLQVGFATNGCHFASSDAPMIGICREALYLEDGQWGVASRSTLCLLDDRGQGVEPRYKTLPPSCAAAQKEGFDSFMEKEIHEQPRVLTDILTGRLRGDTLTLDEVPSEWLAAFPSLTLCACGTSYHAAMVGAYLLERLARIPVKVEIAGEFRYRLPVLDPASLFVVISQSGETADTLEALKLARSQGLTTLALCNVDNSSIVRESDRFILLRAGIEKGVASTKAFSAQVLTLWLMAVVAARTRGHLTGEALERELTALRRTPAAAAVPLGLKERLHRMSKRYLHGHGFFFIGRDIFYPLALEGALKLKEVSYLHAEGYPAGEMKHGPIALADARLFTVALMARSWLFDKVKSNVEELSARDSTIVAITSEYFELADDIIHIQPQDHPMLEFFEMLVVVQLLALEIATRLGNDVDMPRNLAKSVTVE